MFTMNAREKPWDRSPMRFEITSGFRLQRLNFFFKFVYISVVKWSVDTCPTILFFNFVIFFLCHLDSYWTAARMQAPSFSLSFMVFLWHSLQKYSVWSFRPRPQETHYFRLVKKTLYLLKLKGFLLVTTLLL